MLGFLSRESKGINPHLEMRNGKVAQIEVYSKTRCSSLVGLGMSGNFLSCIKGVKYPFMFQEGTWYFSRDTALEKGLISR